MGDVYIMVRCESTEISKQLQDFSNERVLVIGGAGFVGAAIVRQLLDHNATVSVFDIRQPKYNFESSSVKFFIGDICNVDDVSKAIKDQTIIIHTASPPHGQSKKIYFKVNVEGTKNVMDICKKFKVKKLVFTSSASVVFNGTDVLNGDETIPYCDVHMDAYNESKV